MTSPCDGFSLAVSGIDDATGGFFLGFNTTDDHTIVQRTELHELSFLKSVML